MINTEIRLIIFFVAKDGEALYRQQKQDRELMVAQITNSLLQNFPLGWVGVAPAPLHLRLPGRLPPLRPILQDEEAGAPQSAERGGQTWPSSREAPGFTDKKPRGQRGLGAYRKF